MTVEYEENGKVLKGFSQVDLDLLYKWVRALAVIVGLGVLFFFATLWYMIYYIIQNDVVNNFIAGCV